MFRNSRKSSIDYRIMAVISSLTGPDDKIESRLACVSSVVLSFMRKCFSSCLPRVRRPDEPARGAQLCDPAPFPGRRAPARSFLGRPVDGTGLADPVRAGLPARPARVRVGLSPFVPARADRLAAAPGPGHPDLWPDCPGRLPDHGGGDPTQHGERKISKGSVTHAKQPGNNIP